MNIRSVAPVFLLLTYILLLTGCTTGGRVTGASWNGEDPSVARRDTATFEEQLSAHMILLPDEREQRRLQAERNAVGWRDFEQEALHSYDRVYRPWWYTGMPRPGYTHVGIGLGNSLQDLHPDLKQVLLQLCKVLMYLR